jgi:hypothetical protein
MNFDHSLEKITPDFTNILTIGGQALELPFGNTNNRPAGAVSGALRYNTTLGQLEFLGATTWEPIISSVSGNINVTATNVTGTIAIANGGTGQTTVGAALTALLPPQASASGQFLTSNGTTALWASLPNSITSVSIVPANGVSGSVATVSSTSAITLILGAITPSSIAAVGQITGANLSGTNTGDETPATIKAKLGVTALTGNNTGDQTITLSGDVAGSGTELLNVTLANTGVVPGTYTKIIVDSKGRVTAGASLSSNDITNALGFTPASASTSIAPNTSITAPLPPQQITLSGDIVGSGTTAILGTLIPTGTAGTYVGVTTDDKGRVIAGTSTQSWNTITSTPTTVVGYGITNAVTNLTSTPAAIATGDDAATVVYGAMVRASGKFSTIGDAQTGIYVLRNSTTTAVQTELFTDGSSTQIILPTNSAYTYFMQVIGRRVDAVGSIGSWEIRGAISRDATAASVAFAGGGSKTTLSRPTNWDVEVFADTTSGALTVKVTGATQQTIRWVATVVTTEVIG